MSIERTSRREFLRQLACIAASGSSAALFPQLRMLGTALAAAPLVLTGYKALVCVYLAGGNDSWNMLVPYDSTRYNIYATSRSGVYNAGTNPAGLALAQPTTVEQIAAQVITDGADPNPTTNQYFLHPSVPELATLFRQNSLALITNMGTLVRPILMSDYNASAANRPPQLFSHNDQENLWHQANTSTTNPMGWGGLCGDLLKPSNSNQQLSPCISIAGASRFEVGLSTVPYQMVSSGLSSLNGVCNPSGCGGNPGQRDAALNALLSDTYASDFAGEYAKVFKRGRDLYALLSTGLAGTSLATTFPSGNSLASQLQMVAKMIKLSIAQNYAARQIYYVRMGGFDLHDGLMGTGSTAHAALLTQVSQALNAFWSAMGPSDVNAQSEVTLFTASEFARTLSSNGHGSDHAWGGVQMVLGGAVTGGRLYTNGGGPISGFPDQTLNTGNNFNRGQIIPGIGVEQYGATLAQWMGITAGSDLNGIFPNLPNFSSTNLGFV